MLLELFAVAGTQNSGIAHMAHLGGGVIGFIYLLIIYKKLGNIKFGGNKSSNLYDVKPPVYQQPEPTRSGARYTGREKIHDAKYNDIPDTDYKAEYKDQQRMAQERIDAILDKLSEGGYQSLTEEEKRILFKESKNLR